MSVHLMFNPYWSSVELNMTALCAVAVQSRAEINTLFYSVS